MRRIAPEIERVCLNHGRRHRDTLQRGRRRVPVDGGLRHRRCRRLDARLCQAAGCAVWSPVYREVTPDALTEARSLGLKVIPWTSTSAADMSRLIAARRRRPYHDYPDRLRALMAEKDMPLRPRSAAR